MKKIKIISILLILALFISGCTAQENETSLVADEIPCINVLLTKNNFGSKDIDLINQELNKYIIPKLNVKVKLELIDGSVYTQTANQRLLSKEQVDIAYCPSYSVLQNWVEKGLVYPLDNLLNEYGQDIIDAIDPEYIDVAEIDGKIYALPTNRDMAYNLGLEYRADIAQKYGLDMDSVKTFEDLTEIFKQLKEACPEMTPIASAGFSFWDTLGDELGVIMDFENSTTVVNLYETPEYENFIRLIRSWQQSGYMLDTISDSGNNFYYFRSGDIFSSLARGKPGLNTQETRVIGHEMGFIEIIPPYQCTSNISSFLYTITNNSIDREKSMQVLNLMYSDPVVANLLAYGIEGLHYEFVDQENGIITFPEGINCDNSGYAQFECWRKCNQYITYIWEGDPTDIWEQISEFNKNAIRSTAYGFRFDDESVREEVINCKRIRAKYIEGLEAGSLDPDIALPELRTLLKDAGIDKIIAEKQRQLDEWLETER